MKRFSSKFRGLVIAPGIYVSTPGAERGRLGRSAPVPENVLKTKPECPYYFGRDHSPTGTRAVADGDSPAGPAAVLAASHLQGPITTIAQLDHPLSLVAP